MLFCHLLIFFETTFSPKILSGIPSECQTVWLQISTDMFRDFPRPDLGPNMGAFPIQKWVKTSQNGVYYSQYLSSTFWWKFHENPNKNGKVTMYPATWKFAKKCEWKHCFQSHFYAIHSHFYANFHEILWMAIKATNAKLTANIFYFFFKTHSQFRWSKCFFSQI